MKMAMVYAGLLALACVLPVRAAEVREQMYSIGADVDAQGGISALQFDDEPAPIAALLTATAKQWRFKPAMRNGAPVPAHTFIRFRLRVVTNGQGGHNARISFVGNGPRLNRYDPEPVYPSDAMRRRESAFLILHATVQPDGSLADMDVEGRFEHWPALPSFKAAVRNAANRWRAVPEQVDGQPVATRLDIPVTFLAGKPEFFTPKQRDMLREAARKEVVAEAQADAEPGIPLPSEQEIALDSPLQPQSVATVVSGS